jgi:hypothetical protein
MVASDAVVRLAAAAARIDAEGFCTGADRAGGVGRRNAGDRFCHRRAHAYQWRGGHRGDGGGRCAAGAGPAAMIPIGSGVRVWIATGIPTCVAA